jgi:hypothetical protein
MVKLIGGAPSERINVVAEPFTAESPTVAVVGFAAVGIAAPLVAAVILPFVSTVRFVFVYEPAATEVVAKVREGEIEVAPEAEPVTSPEPVHVIDWFVVKSPFAEQVVPPVAVML